LAETQSQLYQSNRMASVGRLAAGIAHEINNPLTGVLTFSSLLLKEVPGGSEMHESLQTIVSETKRCREIVKELLDFSRQVPPHKTNLDLNQVAEKALGIVDHQFAVNNITVTRGLAPALPPVRADGGKMGQVVLNLLVNAADAVEPGAGEIFVGTDLKEISGRPYVELKVADNGHGIPESEQSQIFEPFFTTKDTGTGLGLAVAWGIVNEHGGTITVSSKPAKGTTFTVRLPTVASLEDTEESGHHG
jgi:two-component system NtrC family sensor kinase